MEISENIVEAYVEFSVLSSYRGGWHKQFHFKYTV